MFGRESNTFHFAEVMLFAAHQDEFDLLRLTVHREIAGDFEAAFDRFGARTFELDGRELFGVEIVRLTEVGVASFVCGINAFGFDRQCECRLRRILTVERELAGNVIESAMNPADAQMACLEADR